jgi:hypothetical protein
LGGLRSSLLTSAWCPPIGSFAGRSGRQQFQHLAAQSHRLLDLEQAHDIAVVAVAALAATPGERMAPIDTRTPSSP